MATRASAAAARAGSARLLPIACVVVWIVAAAGARVLGVWLAVGGAAIALGVAVWALDRNRARQLLRPSAGLIAVGAAAGGAMTALTYLLYPVVTHHVPSHRDRRGDTLRGVSRAIAGGRRDRARARRPR